MLQSIGSQRIGHNEATSQSGVFTSIMNVEKALPILLVMEGSPLEERWIDVSGLFFFFFNQYKF